MKNKTIDRLAEEGLKEHLEGRNGEIKRLKAEIERLRAALRPFAEVARGDRLNPTPDEWQRASALVAAE